MNKLLSLVIFSIFSLSLTACSADNKINTEKKDSHTTVTPPNSKKQRTVYFKNDTLKINTATLKLLSIEVLPANKSLLREKPQLAIIYEVKNHSKKKLSAQTVWMSSIELTQESENKRTKLLVGLIPQDDKFAPFTSQKADNIKTNSTAKAVITYDLDDTTTPIKLTATQGMTGKKLGEKIINLK
ncbi:DUF5067 domain-containing protein [Candidatus Enterococcus mansonii]|uniref:DUF5067 domain-containing protein n=1 Tax=Candidatus Enterococcus mansonii TaxID=1834181 RepID=A0A242CJ68_9ENTE|nr:DUF5067 domain-containing protein [Enterococcus sp. 4G2_DIV0659]OTO10251.1 hypothetical protein A5880_000935 [Enterococcus sp. 4G2_DIV0659]